MSINKAVATIQDCVDELLKHNPIDSDTYSFTCKATPNRETSEIAVRFQATPFDIKRVGFGSARLVRLDVLPSDNLSYKDYKGEIMAICTDIYQEFTAVAYDLLPCYLVLEYDGRRFALTIHTKIESAHCPARVWDIEDPRIAHRIKKLARLELLKLPNTPPALGQVIEIVNEVIQSKLAR